jgi:hypothetical protein
MTETRQHYDKPVVRTHVPIARQVTVADPDVVFTRNDVLVMLVTRFTRLSSRETGHVQVFIRRLSLGLDQGKQ